MSMSAVTFYTGNMQLALYPYKTALLIAPLKQTMVSVTQCQITASVNMVYKPSVYDSNLPFLSHVLQVKVT